MFKLKHNVCCVKSSKSGSVSSIVTLHHMTNSMNEIHEAESAAARVAANTALAFMIVYTGMRKRLHSLSPHPALGEPRDFTSGTPTSNRQTQS